MKRTKQDIYNDYRAVKHIFNVELAECKTNKDLIKKYEDYINYLEYVIMDTTIER